MASRPRLRCEPIRGLSVAARRHTDTDAIRSGGCSAVQAMQRSQEALQNDGAQLKCAMDELNARKAAIEDAAHAEKNAKLDAEVRYSKECAKVEQLAQQLAMVEGKHVASVSVLLATPLRCAFLRFNARAEQTQRTRPSCVRVTWYALAGTGADECKEGARCRYCGARSQARRP